uniref:Uncharacterized protein n=1 Tax=Arundo donax TaxID=35708 RepID=A0A0A8Y5K7_ARUDO
MVLCAILLLYLVSGPKNIKLHILMLLITCMIWFKIQKKKQ